MTNAETGQVAHMVYFSLKDGSPAAAQALLESCQHYLTDHPGTEYFNVGLVADDLRREVNDRDFHVSLHIVFSDRAAHDTYQTDERHVAFIDANKANWERVRIFDSYC